MAILVSFFFTQHFFNNNFVLQQATQLLILRVSFLRDAGHFFEKKSKKNSPVFLRATFFLQKKKWP